MFNNHDISQFLRIQSAYVCRFMTNYYIYKTTSFFLIYPRKKKVIKKHTLGDA